jgi:hypothetical protein
VSGASESAWSACTRRSQAGGRSPEVCFATIVGRARSEERRPRRSRAASRASCRTRPRMPPDGTRRRRSSQSRAATERSAEQAAGSLDAQAERRLCFEATPRLCFEATPRDLLDSRGIRARCLLWSVVAGMSWARAGCYVACGCHVAPTRGTYVTESDPVAFQTRPE